MLLYTADFGGQRFHVYDATNDKFYEKITKEDFINLENDEFKIPDGATLVVECAHLREWHKKTMAQPLKYDELVRFKKNCDLRNISIKLFPQNSTPKARKLANYKVQKSNKDFMKEYGISTDEADTRAIANFLLNDSKAFNALKDFHPTKMEDFQKKSGFVFTYLEECNEDLNIAKTQGYGYDKYYDYSDAVTEWIENNMVELTNRLGKDPEAEELLGFKRTYKTKKNPDGNLGVKTASRSYTLVTTILRPDGSLRERHDYRKVPFWQYVKANLFGMKPQHSKQGVVSSNYKHWIRPNVSDYKNPLKNIPKNEGGIDKKCSDFQVGMSFVELGKLKEARTEVDKMTQKIWGVLRNMIVDEGIR